jgi:DNA-binding XRE family transcriptional regulator
MLRNLRETWSLTQTEASKLFGAGKSAFAKWESGQSKLSTPTALLIQVAVHNSLVMPYLAKLANVELDPGNEVKKPKASKGGLYLVQGAYESLQSSMTEASNGAFGMQSCRSPIRSAKSVIPSDSEWGAVEDIKILEAA